MNVTSIATDYAAFGGVLVGFAFTGLSFYVTRPPEPGPRGSETDVLVRRDGEAVHIAPVPVSKVVATGFYAMASLGISTFLYANLAGEGGGASSGAAETAVLIYGVVLALSVLTLFYFVTLMLFERRLTKPAAKPAFWAGTFAGSVVVLRFLAGSAQAARLTRCPAGQPCHPGWLYTTGGITISLAGASVFFAGITLSRILESRRVRWLLTPLATRPSFPPACVFATAVGVATLASLYLSTRNARYVPSGSLIAATYAAGIVLIMFFGVSSGSVIYPRVNSARLTTLQAPPAAGTATNWRGWRGIRGLRATLTGAVDLHYLAGDRPLGEHTGLIWKIPPAGRISTRFRAWHGGWRWRPGGKGSELALIAMPAGGVSHRVHVTFILEKGSEAGSRKEVNVRAGHGPVPVPCDWAEPGTWEHLWVEVRRHDPCRDDVLLYWRRPFGRIDPS